MFKEISAPVFWCASLVIFLLVGSTALMPDAMNEIFSFLQEEVVAEAGWFYILTVALIVIACAFFMMSKFGDVRLGPDHSEPDYSYMSWFAMLFSAGIGIGLLFYGVAEPVMHYLAPPLGEPQTAAAAQEALRITFFHWGIHAWAVYAVVGLTLAYFSYRHGLPLALRSALYPLIGKKINGPIGHAVDIFAIVGCVVGVATSLGLGVSQINAGLNHLIGMEESFTSQAIIVVVVMSLAMVSVLSGLDRGIRRLSEINMLVAIGLLILVLVLGDTVEIIRTFIQNTGSYFSELVDKTFNLYVYEKTDWQGGWTIFYWGWWISWSPFVGMFIARISRGRTIREFLLGVLFVPSGFTFLWMTVFGNSAINFIAGGDQAFATQVMTNNSVALFQFLEHFPASQILSGLAVMMIVIFFVTSADSGALVVSTLATGGKEDSPASQRVYWTTAVASVALILMATGGLQALQTATVLGALPFSFVIYIIIYSLYHSLRLESLKRRAVKNNLVTSPSLASSDESDDQWRDRLENLNNLPRARVVQRFIDTTCRQALRDVENELVSQGFDARFTNSSNGIKLQIMHGEEIDFIYEVRLRKFEKPSFALITRAKQADRDEYFRAEVFLGEGGLNYDIMGYSKEQVISDVIDHYEKHRHFLDIIR